MKDQAKYIKRQTLKIEVDMLLTEYIRIEESINSLRKEQNNISDRITAISSEKQLLDDYFLEVEANELIKQGL